MLVADQLGCAGIAAVEAHEGILMCIVEFALDGSPHTYQLGTELLMSSSVTASLLTHGSDKLT